MGAIRLCRDDERDAIEALVNAAAEAYRGVIPPDRRHGPYMSREQLDAEQIRHACVAPNSQGRGMGGALLEHLMRRSTRRMLVGTWAAAERAIRFYRRHGFEAVGPERTRLLLQSYWSIHERQIATSVVLAGPPLDRP